MTNFTDFSIVWENLVAYFTGSYAILAMFIVGLFFLVLLARGLDIRYSSIFTLPLVGFFVAIGWFGMFGVAQWIVNLGLIVVAFFYGFAILKIT